MEFLKIKGIFIVPNFEDGHFKLMNQDNRELRDIGPKLKDFVNKIERLRQAEVEKLKAQGINNKTQAQQKQEINRLEGQNYIPAAKNV